MRIPSLMLCLVVLFGFFVVSNGPETRTHSDLATGNTQNIAVENNTWVPIIPGAASGTPPKLLPKSSDNAGLLVDSDIPGMYVENVIVGNQTYQQISMPNAGYTAEVGEPQVPVLKTYLEIPYGVSLSLDVFCPSNVTFEGYDVYPVQTPQPDVGTAVASEFVLDKALYTSNESYPPYHALLDEPVIMRGHRILCLSLFPIQHNPVTKQLIAYPKIEARMTYNVTAQIEGIEERLEADEFESLCKTYILNYKLPGAYTTRRFPPPIVSTAVDYLIITNDTFLTQVQPLVDWRRREGYRTMVVTTSTTGSTAVDTKSYIQNAYDTWNPPPTYILLFGDVKLADGGDGVPTNYGVAADSWDTGRVATDLNYSRLDGSDYLPDVLLGRVSVKRSEEATTVVNKIISYEQNPPTGTNWFDDVVIAWSTERQFWIDTSNMINTKLLGHMYTTHTIYCGPGQGAAATQYVIDDISAGCFLVNHRDHGDSRNGLSGSIDGWGDPRFTVFNVTQLTNGQMLPVMFSINCRSGWFDGETDEDTTDPSGGVDCLGETWLKTANRGGVAFIGSTRVSTTGYNDYLCRGLYDAIWPDFLSPTQAPMYELGQILTYGKINMISYRGYNDATTKQELEEFHLLGDPATSIWTAQPRTLTVTHPSAIGSGGYQRFVVKVTDAGNPVADCLICIDNADDIHKVAYTDAGGYATFRVLPSGGGSLNVTVTKHNYLPYLGIMTVTANGATITVSPTSGFTSDPFTVTGTYFASSETVTIYMDNTYVGSVSTSFGGFTKSFNVPSGPTGFVNVIATGQSSGRAAVMRYDVIPPQPSTDPYIYSQWDSSTWYLNPSGGDPVWDNPEIQLKETSTGNPVSSGNLKVGTPYTIEATIHNAALVAATGTQVTFRWADYGAGQLIWNLIGTQTVNVPASPGTVKASLTWTPIVSGHCCITVEIYHSLDSHTGNNKGQENCQVYQSYSPAVIDFTVFNPTNTSALVYLEVTQKANGTELWPTEIDRSYPQVLPPLSYQDVTLTVNASTSAKPGEYRIVTVTATINGETIGGVDFIVFKAGRDVAVTNVASSRTIVGQGYGPNINVTVTNQGSFEETFNMTCYYGNGSLTPEMWHVFWSFGDATLDGRINQADLDFLTANFNWHGPPGANRADVNSDGVVNMKDISDCIAHYELEIWAYYLSGAVIGTVVNMSLTAVNYKTVAVTWNLTGLAMGNYSIGAYAEPVENETDLDDNTLSDAWVTVTVPGDINGDSTVNILDAIQVSNAFLATPSSSNWNPNADINGDNVVNILDAIILANHFLQHYP